MDDLTKLHESFNEQLKHLERKLEDARERGWKIADLIESVKVKQRLIEETEGLMLVKGVTDGTINGKNEDTRKTQRMALLSLERDKEPLSTLYKELEQLQGESQATGRMREQDLDEIKIIEYRLHHINALLRAMAIS